MNHQYHVIEIYFLQSYVSFDNHVLSSLYIHIILIIATNKSGWALIQINKTMFSNIFQISVILFETNSIKYSFNLVSNGH